MCRMAKGSWVEALVCENWRAPMPVAEGLWNSTVVRDSTRSGDTLPTMLYKSLYLYVERHFSRRLTLYTHPTRFWDDASDATWARSRFLT